MLRLLRWWFRPVDYKQAEDECEATAGSVLFEGMQHTRNGLDEPEVVAIDLSQALNKREAELLNQLVKTQAQSSSQENNLIYGNDYRIKLSTNQIIQIRLVGNILRYQRKKETSEADRFRYALFHSTQDHFGGMANLFISDKSMKIKNETLIVKQKLKNKERIIKVQPNTRVNYFEDKNEKTDKGQTNDIYPVVECQMSKLAAPYLKMKDYAKCSFDRTALIMRKLPGRDLYYHFNFEHAHYVIYSILMRLKICRALVRELQKIHERGVVHGDISMGNAILSINHVDYSASTNMLSLSPKDAEMEVKYIDFAFARRCDDKRLVNHGTIEYASPEARNKSPLTRASDVYSLGKLFGFIWQYGERGDFLKTKDYINTYDQIIMADLIKSMCEWHPADRASLNVVMSVLDELYAKHQRNQASSVVRRIK